MDRRDFATVRALEVTLETPSVRSRSNSLDAFLSVLISAVVTPHINNSYLIILKQFTDEWNCARYPILSED